MQTADFSGSDLPPDEDQTPRSRSKNKILWILLHAVAFLLGFAALIALILFYSDSIWPSLVKVGWGFFAIVGLNLLRHLLRAASMYRAVASEHRTFKYRWAVAARFGGEAVTFFTFTGPFLGDATKAVLMKKDLPLTHGASAVIIDNILYYVSVILVVLTGVAVLLFNYGSSGSAMSNVLFVIVVASVLAFAGLSLAILYRVTPLTHAIDFLARRHLAPKFLLRKRKDILAVEKNVFQFYHNRPADFFTVFFISLSVHAVSVTEVFLALRFLGFDAQVSTAFIIESLTKVINVVFGFVPGTIGVYEGGNGAIFHSLGYPTGIGIALALVRHGAIFFSTFIGVLILLWRTLASGAKHLGKPPD